MPKEELSEAWIIKHDIGNNGAIRSYLDHEPSRDEILAFCKRTFTNTGSVTVEKKYIYVKPNPKRNEKETL